MLQLCSACMCAQSFQLCPTLCDPMDSSRAGSSVHGILQARMLECVSRPSFQGIFPTLGSNLSLPLWRQILCLLSHLSSVQLLSRVQLFAAPWTAAIIYNYYYCVSFCCTIKGSSLYVHISYSFWISHPSRLSQST